MASRPPIRIGTRRSALARWQAEWVAGRLRALGADVALVPLLTQGDRRQQAPAGPPEDTGLFTKEIQNALLDGRADLAVHSLKDLPTATVEGVCLAAVPPRGPAADAIICRACEGLEQLPQGAAVGTGSLRRQAQLLHARPDLRVVPVRGNVDTRLAKLDAGQFDAVVLAEAGLRRLGLEGRITRVLPPEVLLPAVGQGALGLEARAHDRPLLELLAALDDAPSHAAVRAERAMLAALEGGCLAPVAAWARVEGGRLVLTGRVLDPRGTRKTEATRDAAPRDAELLGRQVAGELLSQGAGNLVRAARQGDCTGT